MCAFMQLLCLPKGLFSVKLASVNEVSCIFLILTCVSNVKSIDMEDVSTRFDFKAGRQKTQQETLSFVTNSHG